jgi:ketoreductase RED2
VAGATLMSALPRRLDGKVALVTGSSSGIGEATARAFAELGASVVVNSRSNVAAGEALANELPNAVHVQADVSKESDIAKLLDAAHGAFGRLDVLVNNAGTTEVIAHQDLKAADLAVWRRIFEVNVFGTWAMSVAAMESLAEHDGAIVNVTSIAGLRPTGSSIPYAASKAALNHMTLLLAKVVGPQVRVNAVAPGLIDTPWTEDWDVVREFFRAIAPMKRSGTPQDVADVIVDLSLASWMTGQVVAIDGGFTLAG